MKNLKILFLILCSVTVSHAQNELALPLEIDEHLISQYHLGNAGFILRTNERIIKFSSTGEKIAEHSVKGLKGMMISSADGSKIFLITADFENPFKKSQQITELDVNGKSSEFEIEGSKDYGKEVTEIFASDEYLFFLTRDEISKKEQGLFLNSFESGTMRHKKIKLEVPQAEDAYWQYLGQWGDQHYICLKDIEPARSVNNIHIASFDANGTLSGVVSIPFTLDNNFIRPSLNLQTVTNEWQVLADHSFKEGTRTTTVPGVMQGSYNQTGTGPAHSMSRGPATTYSSGTLHPNSGAFMYVTMDRHTGEIYIYGLLGKKATNKSGIANKYEGFYIYKYDVQGKEIWKLQQTDTPELTNEKIFFIHGTPGERLVNFLILPEGKINFNISFRKTMVNYSITKDGKVTTFKKNEDVEDVTEFPGIYSELPVQFPDTGDAKKKKWQVPDVNTIFIGSGGYTVMHYSVKDKPGVIHLTFFLEE